MPCETLENEKGQVIGFACGGVWGVGIKRYPEYAGTEFEYIYGFGGGGDPHDFYPDDECNTKRELAAWEKAKAECKCGR